MIKANFGIVIATSIILAFAFTYSTAAKTPDPTNTDQVELNGFELFNHNAKQFVQEFIAKAAVRAKATDNNKLAQRVRLLIDHRKPVAVRQEFEIPGYNVLNSVAVLAPNLPSSKNWQTVSSNDFSALYFEDCDISSAACRSPFAQKMQKLLPSLKSASPFQALSQVNRAVNNTITYREDSEAFGKSDYWANPVELAQRGVGDCEDFAIAKYWALRALGYQNSQLQLVVLKDTRRNLYHAVLAVHDGGRTYILDNLSNNIAEQAAFPNYMPIFSFVADVAYIHGRSKTNTAQIQLVASN